MLIEIPPSGFSKRPILCPKFGSLPIQIHQILLAIDLDDRPCAVLVFTLSPTLKRFLLSGLGSGALAGDGAERVAE